MAEYIDRQKALDLAKTFSLDIDCDDDPMLRMFSYVTTNDIKTIPAAAVRPVVLCRDCKWTNTDEMEDPAIYCWKWDRWEMPPDGFCWLGKKREES